MLALKLLINLVIVFTRISVYELNGDERLGFMTQDVDIGGKTSQILID